MSAPFSTAASIVRYRMARGLHNQPVLLYLFSNSPGNACMLTQFWCHQSGLFVLTWCVLSWGKRGSSPGGLACLHALGHFYWVDNPFICFSSPVVIVPLRRHGPATVSARLRPLLVCPRFVFFRLVRRARIANERSRMMCPLRFRCGTTASGEIFNCLGRNFLQILTRDDFGVTSF
jgi:hypothetical protein